MFFGFMLLPLLLLLLRDDLALYNSVCFSCGGVRVALRDGPLPMALSMASISARADLISNAFTKRFSNFQCLASISSEH